jgi:glucose-1-phosphate thymidylyltransferase
MKYILLCAGYATRMYPLIENFPKPLLDIKGKALIDYLIEDLENNNLIDEYIIISNHKFINHFNEWKNNNKHKNKISLLDDGTTNNDNRLGAIKDIWFAIENANINDDILVLAGDNLLNSY